MDCVKATLHNLWEEGVIYYREYENVLEECLSSSFVCEPEIKWCRVQSEKERRKIAKLDRQLAKFQAKKARCVSHPGKGQSKKAEKNGHSWSQFQRKIEKIEAKLAAYRELPPVCPAGANRSRQ